MRPHVIKARAGGRPLFIFADHASRHIPKALNNLGLNGDDLTRHIAHDVGTMGLLEGLCERFGCGGQAATISRLVIDVNRDPNAEGLIPQISDGTKIAGNFNVNASERARRISAYHAPYHSVLGENIERAARDSCDPLIVSLHSFTPNLRTDGLFRMTEIGLLFKSDPKTAQLTAAQFTRMGRNFSVGMNRPYSAFDLNYTVDVQVTPRGLRHVTFEVRQDLIGDKAGERDMVDVLARVISRVI
ncbi:MAG: N-formylglutamate amidohydrolase [Robiginitomaculum sp.]